jgi:hypothetical protein
MMLSIHLQEPETMVFICLLMVSLKWIQMERNAEVIHVFTCMYLARGQADWAWYHQTRLCSKRYV